MTARALIVITAKAPVPGRVKTRLLPALAPDQTAMLHTAFLIDTLDLARAVGEADVMILCPKGDASALAAIAADPGIEVFEQVGEGLPAALDDALGRFTTDGRRVVALDSDSPHLSAIDLRAALRALAHADLVVGPTADGGYYLVGARAGHPGLFLATGVGTGRALTQLRDYADERGLSVWTGPEEFDVDAPGDLARLADLLRHDPSRAPRTTALLSQ